MKSLNLKALQKELSRALTGTVRVSHLVAPHTSFNLGGPADLWIEPEGAGDVAAAVSLLKSRGCPVTVLGSGTNCLVSDLGIRGAVLWMVKGFRQPPVIAGEQATADAGVSMPMLSQQLSKLGLSGYEWACGIPGSVGGSVVMNAGAHGGDTAGVTTHVQLVSERGECGWLPASELGFAYRHSRLQNSNEIVLSARLQLRRDDAQAIRARLKEFRDRRRAAQPETSQCAGSIFRNPPGASAGRILEELGAKGTRVGGAEVSEKHANFIVNCGGATAANVRDLILRLQKLALETRGVELRPEVLFLGEWSSPQDDAASPVSDAAPRASVGGRAQEARCWSQS